MAAEDKMPGGKQKKAAGDQPARPAPTQSVTQSAALSLPPSVVQRAQADPSSLSRADVDALQRTIGMRATQRILAQQVAPRTQSPTGFLVQTKLAVGPAGDKYEQEADAVARRVVEQSPPLHSPVATAQVAPRVQRKVTIEDVEEEPVRQPEPPREIVQPSTPLMLADAPWSEVEARETLARRERSQAEDPRYQQRLAEIRPTAPKVGKLKRDRIDALGHALEDTAGRREQFQTVDPRYQQKLGQIRPTAPKVGTLDQGRIEPLGSALQDTTGRREKAQAVDPRYQQKLAEIRPTAPKVGILARGRIDALGNALQDTAGRKEAFQTVDPRYQQKLAQIRPTAPEAKPLDSSRGEALKQAMAQDKANQLERMLAKEKEEREKKELADVRREAGQLEIAAKEKIKLLIEADSKELQQDSTLKAGGVKLKQQTQESLGYWQQKLQNAQYALQWATQRLSRRSLLSRLKDEIGEQKVPGPYTEAFKQQGAREYAKIEAPLLTADRQNTQGIMAAYRKALSDLVAAHKKVDDLDKQTGARYGGAGVQSLMETVTATIGNVGFDVVTDTPGLDDQIKAVREGVGNLGTSLRGRMVSAREAEGALSGHTTAGQDPRGKKEESDAIQKAKDAFKEVQSKIKGREAGIDSKELAQLVDTTGVLTSFANRKKEKQAHDMKALYEAAPYHLDPNTSKVVHAERHTKKGGSGYKTAAELETDYKSEVDKQYIASKEIWCKYLGYTKGEANARVTNNVGSHDGKPGHHSVFLGDYSAAVSAKVGKASDGAADKSAAQLLDVLYPSAGTGGAHYTLEFAEPKPHAYRGGPVIPGARYQADRVANNATWIAARDFMAQKQLDEEARVRGLLQAALDNHMMVVHRKDPDRRK